MVDKVNWRCFRYSIITYIMDIIFNGGILGVLIGIIYALTNEHSFMYGFISGVWIYFFMDSLLAKGREAYSLTCKVLNGDNFTSS